MFVHIHYVICSLVGLLFSGAVTEQGFRSDDLNVGDNNVIYEESLRVIIGRSPAGVDQHNRKFNVVLITEEILGAICWAFYRCTQSNDYFRPESVDENSPERYDVRTYHESRPISVVSCGIFDKCKVPHIFAVGIIISLALPVRETPFEILDVASVLAFNSSCRVHSHFKKRASDKGVHYGVLKFVPTSGKYNDCSLMNTEQELCGSVWDPNHQFCSMLPGAIVMCDGNLLGISQTACQSSNKEEFMDKTEFSIVISLIGQYELEYWKFLETRYDPRGRGGVSGMIPSPTGFFTYILCNSILYYK